MLDQQIHEGHVFGMAEGAVLVDPTADPKNESGPGHSRPHLERRHCHQVTPLGFGGQPTAPVACVSARKYRHSINRRFFTFIDGRKQGVATPKTGEFIDIAMHPRYHDNIGRYMQILRNIAIDESANTLQARLLVPGTAVKRSADSANAAMRLEAIGDDQAKQILKQGISIKRSRKYASTPLKRWLISTTPAAVTVLADVARNEPSFRVNALAALSAMDDASAYDALRSLLEVKSAETRYGAFRALWAMNEHDPFLHDENLSDQFHYHVLDVPGPDMVHVTQSHLPEIVLFGKDQKFQLPLMLDAGKSIMVNGMKGDKITVSKFATRIRNRNNVLSRRSVDEVIRAIVALGGTYPDVVQALQQAKTDGALPSRFEVDALPAVRPGIRPHRSESEGGSRGQTSSKLRTTNPRRPRSKSPRRCPNLFSRPR